MLARANMTERGVTRAGVPVRIVALAIVLAALIPSAYLTYLAQDCPQLGRYHDDGLYWTAARSLARGTGHRIISLPGQPYQTKYPPLYPLALSVVWRVQPDFPGNVVPAVWLNWLCVPLFVLASYLVTEQFGISPPLRIAVAIMVALHPLVSFLGLFFMADLPFCALTLFSLTLAHRAFRDRSGMNALAAGVVGALAYVTKTAALPLLVIPIFFIAHRRPKQAAVTAGPLLSAMIGWHAWSYAHKSGTFLYYTDYLGYYLSGLTIADIPRIFSSNLLVFATAIGRMAVFDTYGGLRRELILVIIALVLAVAVFSAIRRNGVTVYTVFAGGYSLMLLAWNYPPDPRFVLPLMPLVLAGLLSAWRPSPRLLTFGAIVAVAVAAVHFDALVNALPRFVGEQRALRGDRNRAFAWIAQNGSGASKIITEHDTMLYLLTGRAASRMDCSPLAYYRGDVQQALAGVKSMITPRREGTAYLIRTPDYFNLLADHKAALWRYVEQSSAFSAVYRAGSVTIYRVDAQ